MTKKILRSLLISGLTFTIAALSAQANDDYSLYTKAMKRMLASSYQGWSFTQSSNDGGKVEVTRYDGTKAGMDKWTLLSIDGKKPSKRQLKKYRKKMRKNLEHKKEQGAEEHDGNIFLATLVKPGSLKLAEENELHSIYHFRPVMDEDDEKEMEQYLYGEMIIRRDIPLIKQVRLYSKGEFPVDGAKIKIFNQLMQFAPVDPENHATGPVFFKSILVKVKGKAMGLFGFDQTTDIKFSDYSKAMHP